MVVCFYVRSITHEVLDAFAHDRDGKYKNEGENSGEGREWRNRRDTLQYSDDQEVDVSEAFELEKERQREEVVAIVLGSANVVRLVGGTRVRALVTEHELAHFLGSRVLSFMISLHFEK